MWLTARAAADGLGWERAAVLEYLSSEDSFLLRAAVGWADGLVGSARFPTGRLSQAGYTFQIDRTLVVDDVAGETRFVVPTLLLAQGVVCGASTVIRTRTGRFGVLAAHSTVRRRITSAEAGFLEAVAEAAGSALNRVAASA